jgi:phospho-N-acetylmuramoyl-pentapeptide-transferase
MIIDVVKVFVPTAIAFFVGIAMTPILTHYLYKYKMWQKKGGKCDMSGKNTPIFNSLHAETDIKTPRMGGIVIWGSVLITVIIIWLFSEFFPNTTTGKLNFLHRNTTWLPLFTLISGSIVGLFNDWLDVSCKEDKTATGLSLRKRLLIVFFIGLIGAYWFFFKLGVSSVSIPFDGIVNIGYWFVPFFIVVMMAVYAGGVIDGIDGLAGGVFASTFSAYGIIAFYQQQIDISAFCFVVVGGILAFLWFNIPPARFYMTETGTMGLTLTLAVVAFLTDAHVEGKGVAVLPVVAFPLVVTVLSNVVQVTSKKIRHKKVFLVAPIHHHFEAIGWPSYKVTMRYWILSIIFALIGVIVALSGSMI